MRQTLILLTAAVLIGGCKKTGEGEYQVKTPDVTVGTDTHTVRTPSVDIGRDTHVIERPSIERKGDTLSIGRTRDTIVTPNVRVRP
jgi:hypothetical protein